MATGDERSWALTSEGVGLVLSRSDWRVGWYFGWCCCCCSCESGVAELMEDGPVSAPGLKFLEELLLPISLHTAATAYWPCCCCCCCCGGEIRKKKNTPARRRLRSLKRRRPIVTKKWDLWYDKRRRLVILQRAGRSTPDWEKLGKIPNGWVQVQLGIWATLPVCDAQLRKGAHTYTRRTDERTNGQDESSENG